MSYDSRLFRKPQLKRIVELSDDINDACTMLNDCLAAYEDADTLPSAEAVEEREAQRDEAWNLAQTIRNGALELAALMDRLEATDTDTAPERNPQ